MRTVSSLATEADSDLDEALVTLWDAGIEVEDESSTVPPSELARARRSLGIDAPKAQTRVDYWMRRLEMDRAELTERLRDMEVVLAPRARVLPKGALRRLRRAYGTAPTVAELDATLGASAPEAPPFEWHTIGSPREIRYLGMSDVCEVHDALVADFAADDDPIFPPGVKSEDLLSSALSRPHTSMFGELKYQSVEMAGAALLHSLVLNHPFHNGNKRTGLVSLLVFLDRNAFMATCDEKALFRFVLKVAAHGLVPMSSDNLADREVLEIAHWIRINSRPIDKGERPLQWHKVKRILRQYDCAFDHSSSVGNRINIVRTVDRPRRLLGRQRRSVSTQVHYGNEGSVVDRNTMHKLRADLELDEQHGCDSRAFYEADTLPDDFIQQYRTLLRRLGRL